MRLALAIINYNTAPDLRSCLTSVRERLGEMPTVVVDNGSTDGSREMVKAEFPWARLLDNPGNPGYASACNRGIEATDEPYIFILNSDVEFLEDGLETILDYLDSHPRVGILGPLVLNSDGSVQMSCRRFPSLVDSLVHGFLGEVWPDNPFTKSYQMKGMTRDEPCEADWVSGAAMIVRREALEKAGAFDERYFMYVEDVDLCWRLREAGFTVVYHPDFRLVHHIGRASSQQSLRMLYQHHRSMYLFFLKRNPGWKGALLAPAVLAGLAARFALTWLIRKLRSPSRPEESI